MSFEGRIRGRNLGVRIAPLDRTFIFISLTPTGVSPASAAATLATGVNTDTLAPTTLPSATSWRGGSTLLR